MKNTNTQYNYPAFAKRITAASNRTGLQQRFEEPSARKSIEADLYPLDVYHRVLLDLESEIKRQAKHHDHGCMGAEAPTSPDVGYRENSTARMSRDRLACSRANTPRVWC